MTNGCKDTHFLYYILQSVTEILPFLILFLPFCVKRQNFNTSLTNIHAIYYTGANHYISGSLVAEILAEIYGEKDWREPLSPHVH